MRIDDLIEKLKEVMELQHDPGLPICIEETMESGTNYYSDLGAIEVVKIDNELVLLLKPEYEDAPVWELGDI